MLSYHFGQTGVPNEQVLDRQRFNVHGFTLPLAY